MGPTELNGLPAHVLLVHVVVVLVPLTCLLLLLAVLWPTARRRIGIVLPVVALVSLVSVPVTTHAGEWLQARVDSDPLVERHAQLGDQLLPWAIGLFVVCAAVWALHRFVPGAFRYGRRPVSDGPGTATASTRDARLLALDVVVVVAALVVAVGSSVMVYRIGDSGAKASWHDGFSATPHGGG
jgi:hypothetical protein